MPIGDTELPHWHVNIFRQRGSHENFLLQEMWNQSQELSASRQIILPVLRHRLDGLPDVQTIVALETTVTRLPRTTL